MTNFPTATMQLPNPKSWLWQGFPITYQQCGEEGTAIVLVHGFGACWGHWRKNLAVLGRYYRCYALDLIGFGDSAKPQPGKEINYTFEVWGQLVADFCKQVVGSPAFLVGNSIGCVVIMQTAVDYSDQVLGIAAINCSLRLLHDRKKILLPWYKQLVSNGLQRLFNNRAIGHFFFQQVAKPKMIRKILLQAYGNPEAVTDELIDILLKPAQDPGAADVFLAFIHYSQGPLPEDLLPRLSCPTIFLWGTADPWEAIALGQEFANYPMVEKFIPLKGVGHCPQDEAPELVNEILLTWLAEKCA